MKIFRSRLTELERLHTIQKSAFAKDIDLYGPLEGSPALETIETLKERLCEGHYYSLYHGQTLIGGAFVTVKDTYGRLNRLYIDPQFQDKGYGKRFVKRLFIKYPLVSKWTLDTPIDNQMTCHFYESLGFKALGKTVITDKLTLVDYMLEKPQVKLMDTLDEKNFGALLIDLDNTLFDYNRAEVEAMKETLSRHDLSESYETYKKAYQPINHDLWDKLEKGEISKEALKVKRFELVNAALKLDKDASVMSRDYIQALANASATFPYALEVMNILHKHFRTVALSNGIEEVQEGRLKGSGLDQVFHANAISEAVGVNKPHPLIFEKAIEWSGFEGPKEKILMVGDSLVADIKGASDYGIATCWMNYNYSRNDSEIAYDYEINSILELLWIVGEPGLED